MDISLFSLGDFIDVFIMKLLEIMIIFVFYSRLTYDWLHIETYTTLYDTCSLYWQEKELNKKLRTRLEWLRAINNSDLIDIHSMFGSRPWGYIIIAGRCSTRGAKLQI